MRVGEEERRGEGEEERRGEGTSREKGEGGEDGGRPLTMERRGSRGRASWNGGRQSWQGSLGGGWVGGGTATLLSPSLHLLWD